MYPVCYRIKIFNISRAIRAFSWQFLNVTKLFLEASLTYLHDDQACLITVKIRKVVGNKLQKIKYRWENLTAVWSSQSYNEIQESQTCSTSAKKTCCHSVYNYLQKHKTKACFLSKMKLTQRGKKELFCSINLILEEKKEISSKRSKAFTELIRIDYLVQYFMLSLKYYDMKLNVHRIFHKNSYSIFGLHETAEILLRQKSRNEAYMKLTVRIKE